ncbi:MAG: CvpA family protein [Bacteroidota bacterium]
MRFDFIDVFLIGGLGLGAYLGYRGGLAKKLFNLLMLLVAIVVAVRFMHTVGSWFTDAGIMAESASYVVAFLLLMLAVMIPALLLYRRFGKAAGSVKSGTAVVGLALGVLEGAMISSFLLMGLRVFDFPDESTRKGSLLYRPLVRFVPKTFDTLRPYLPGASEFKEELTRRFRDVDLFDTGAEPGKHL